MAYIRKTIDEYRVEQLTAEGWEEVCCEFSRREARKRLKEYQLNQPQYFVRIKVKRIPIKPQKGEKLS